MPAVTVYTGSFCGYCLQVKALLERSGRRTLPQVFVGERYIGGADELRALDASGELIQLTQKEE